MMAEFSEDAPAIFRDLRLPGSLRITQAFTYMAQATAEEGEVTRPLLRVGSQTIAVLHSKPDGREYLALTFDNNPNLLHSLLLQRGLIDWLTRGVHLGWRKAWLMPQVDDLFLPNFLFDLSQPECATSNGPAVNADGLIPCWVSQHHFPKSSAASEPSGRSPALSAFGPRTLLFSIRVLAELVP